MMFIEEQNCFRNHFLYPMIHSVSLKSSLYDFNLLLEIILFIIIVVGNQLFCLELIYELELFCAHIFYCSMRCSIAGL